MKKIFTLSLMLLFVYNLQAVVLVTLNESSLTNRETAVIEMFNGYGIIANIKGKEASFDELKNFNVIVATEDGAITKETVDQLIENGNHVYLLFNAGIPLGGNWVSHGSITGYRTINIERNEIFFDGYASNLNFNIQSGATAYAIGSEYPIGWTAVARNNVGSSNKTVLYREHTSGGKGLIFTYNPSAFSPVGKNVADLIYQWFEGAPAFPGKTVPDGNVAFVITNYDDGDNPDLTDSERAHYIRLLDQGYEVSFIRFSRLSHSDLSSAALITAVEYPSMNSQLLNGMLSEGHKVLLMYSSGGPFSTSWNYGATHTAYRHLIIEQNSVFFNGFASNLSSLVQSTRSGYSMSADYPIGWNSIGRNSINSTHKTVLYREHASSGGKALMFTYDPAGLSGVGTNFTDLVDEWLQDRPVFAGKTVPDGNVAFVITNYDDGDNPDLTDSERAHYIRLLDQGYEVSFIRFSRLSHSDLSSAALITAVEYPSMNSQLLNGMLSEGHKVLLMYSSGGPFSTSWNYGATHTAYRHLIIEQNSVFFNGYASNLSSLVQSTRSGYSMSADYPIGWNSIGRNSINSTHKTVLYREHASSGGKALMFTYDPAGLSGVGKNFTDLVDEWLQDRSVFAGKTVPDGNVAFVITNYDDGDNPDLTDSERAHYIRLLDQGYEVSFIRFSRLSHSDLSSAALITAVEYPSMNSQLLNGMLSEGHKVLLMYSSGGPFSTSWNYGATHTAYWHLIIEQNSVFFNGFASNLSSLVQSTRSGYSMSADYPIGWNSIGRNSINSTHKTVLYREHASSGGKALMFTYDPAGLSGVGTNFTDLVDEWLQDRPVFAGKTVPDGNVAFVITNYDDGDNPDLTDSERAHYIRLLDQGYEVSFIRFSRLSHSDLSSAALITAVEYPSMNSQLLNGMLSEGHKVLLMYSSGGPFSTSWNYGATHTAYRHLIIEQNSVFFNGYASNLSSLVQSTRSGYSMSADYPIGWNSIGRNSINSTHKTVLYREHASSGGKALMFTYDPAGLSGVGKNFTDLVDEWLQDRPVFAGKTVPDGNVAFVITNYDDEQINPELTSLENSYYNYLVSQGYEISFLRFSTAFNSDLSKAKFVTGIEYPSLSSVLIDNSLNDGVNILAAYKSGAVIGGEWNSLNNAASRNLIVENNSCFLSDYMIDELVAVQDGGEGIFLQSGYPSRWKVLGRNSQNVNNKTTLTKNSPSARAVVFSYNTALLTQPGVALLNNIIDFFGEPIESMSNSAIIHDAYSYAGELITINIEVVNEYEFSGFAFEVTMPEGFSYVEESGQLYRKSDHVFSVQLKDENTLLLVSNSPSDLSFEGNNGILFSIQLITPNESGDYNLIFDDALIYYGEDEIRIVELQHGLMSLVESVQDINILRGGPEHTSPMAIPVQIAGFNAAPYRTDLDQWTGNWQAPQAIYDQGEYVNHPLYWSHIEGNIHSGSTWLNNDPGESYGILIVDLKEVQKIYNISVFQMNSDGRITHIALASHSETGEETPDAFNEGWQIFLPVSAVSEGDERTDYVTKPSLFSVDHSTRYIKIMAWNDGSLGDINYIELKGIKMYGEGTLPVVLTEEIRSITSTDALVVGNVIYEGTSSVTQRGLLWSNLPEPDLDNHTGHTNDGSGLGEFLGDIRNIYPETTYYVRAYAMNENGISYGSVASFTTPAVGVLYRLYLESSPSDLEVSLTGEGFYQEGDRIQIKAGEIEGYEFLFWDGDENDLAHVENPDEMETFVNIPDRGLTIIATYQTALDFREPKQEELRVFPNPFSDKIYIKTATGIDYIRIYNAVGSIMVDKRIDNQEFMITLDAGDFPAGIYILNLVDLQGGARTYKIVKQ
ncbi:T9SS type A sorting domain-containing protein [Alkalitalea saponilacus]|uniref:T9SS type A sorting domain-containing protein n=2 Tax=Alkalitalea saponilacus TaxID=889453 RepID=UPI0012F96C92|nr:T9SS type A sorting domain-containing protein [Alkalitalea saponilacus]